MGQKISTTQWYVYGRRHFTRTGWQKAQAKYDRSIRLEDMDLSGRIFLVTGANAGIGKELTQFLSSRKGKVYMVCRNRERAEKARDEISAAVGDSGGTLQILLGDVSLRSDVERVMNEFSSLEDHLDGLVCNAGALAAELTRTSEGYEQTFACHLLFGSYTLSKLAQPLLKKSTDPRVVFVSSGGMYNTKFPALDIAMSTKSNLEFSGQMAYAIAKRGQVLLAEKLAERESKATVDGAPITYVSCHPGWVDTVGVDSAFGEKKKWFEPLRTPWQGTEGIAWLCAAPAAALQPGAFYLDRTPQTKYLSGYFMSEGKFTKNTDAEVEEMMTQLEKMSRSADLESAGVTENMQSS